MHPLLRTPLCSAPPPGNWQSIRGARVDRFEFFFSIYSLLLGLALAELMLGYANLLRSPRRPAWGVLTPAVSLLILLEILVTFLDAWMKLQLVQLNLVGLLAPTAIALGFFLVAVMAVPRNNTDWESLDDYFHDRKKWILSLLVLPLLINVLFIELPLYLRAGALSEAGTTGFIEWVIANTVIVALHLAPLLSRNRWANLLPMAALVAILFYYYGTYVSPAAAEKQPPSAPPPAAASESAPNSPPPAPAR